MSNSSITSQPERVAVAELSPERREHQRYRVKVWWILAMAVALWCLLTSVSSAQKYETFELDKKFDAFKDPKKASELERALMQYKTASDASKVAASVPSMVEFYLEKYIPWKLTQKENLPVLASTIEGMLKDLETAQRIGGPGERALLKSIFVGMKLLAEGNYMPAVRINAINALSRLHVKGMDIATGRPPQPLSYSYPILLKLYTNEKENEGVRAAALHGLHQYTSLGFPYMKPEERKALADEMNKLLAAAPPASRNPKAHAYLQRFAVDILDNLRAPNDASLGTQLISISTSEKQPDLIALYSASKLGSFDTGLQGKVTDPAAVTKQWSLRAFNALEAELARFEAQTRPAPAMSQPPNPLQFLQKSATPTNRAAAGRAGMGRGEGMDMSDMEMSSSGGSSGGRGMRDMMSEMDMMSGMDSGMYGGGMMPVQANPQPPEVSLSRRHLSFVLQQLLNGATGSTKGEITQKPSGLIAAVADPQKTEIKTWVESVQGVVDALNDTSLDTLDAWLIALEEQRRPLGLLAGVKIEQAEDPDKIEARPLLPGFGLPAGDAEEVPGALPAGLPGLPGT
jgi:hypothetical protein